MTHPPRRNRRNSDRVATTENGQLIWTLIVATTLVALALFQVQQTQRDFRQASNRAPAAIEKGLTDEAPPTYGIR